jgi:hypothetical protein
MKDSSITMRSMAVQYFTDQSDAEHLHSMSLTEKDPDIQVYILESLAEIDPIKAKEFAMRLLESTDKTPVIYLAPTTIAAVDIDEALRQASRYYERNLQPSMQPGRSFARKGSGASIEFFKDDRAKNLPLIISDFVSSVVSYISSASTVQDEGYNF